jgi:hypothetical protein
MSIGEFTMAEAALSEQPVSSTSKKPPPKRLAVAVADAATQPEPR